MPIKREKKTKFTAPVLDVRMTQLQIIEGTVQEEPVEITTKSGESVTSKPSLNAKIEVVNDLQNGEYDGIQFYDRFVLKQNQDGEWIIKQGTKLGYLCEARYGESFFEDDNNQEFDKVQGQPLTLSWLWPGFGRGGENTRGRYRYSPCTTR